MKDKNVKKCLSEMINKSKIIVIVGLSKNAGKTTSLNWVCKNTLHRNIGISSTGRDGEDFDLVEGHKKPKVFIKKDTIYTTLIPETLNQPGNIEIIEKLPYKASGKNLWLVKALTDLDGEIVGPAKVSEQIKIIEKFKLMGVELILIDGALNRKSIALSKGIDSIILVASPDLGQKEEVLKELIRLKTFIHFPILKAESFFSNIEFNSPNIIFDENILFKNEGWLGNEIKKYNPKKIIIPGAITNKSFDKIFSLIQNNESKWIFMHSLQFHLDINKVNKLINSKKVFVSGNFPVKAVFTNSYSSHNNHFDCEDFKEEVVKIFDDIPVYDVLSFD